MKRTEAWPTDDELLMLVVNSQEHKRAHGTIYGLAKELQKERTRPYKKVRFFAFNGEKPDDYNKNVHHLEQKLIKKKKIIRELEECRTFERETEELLLEAVLGTVKALENSDSNLDELEAFLADIIQIYNERLGPRPDKV